MITPISDDFFVLNKQLRDSEKQRIEKQIEILQSLILTPYDLLMVEPSSEFEFQMKLYDDPVITLVEVESVGEKHLKNVGISTTFMQMFGTEYLPDEQRFHCPIDMEAYLLKHQKNALFVLEYPA